MQSSANIDGKKRGVEKLRTRAEEARRAGSGWSQLNIVRRDNNQSQEEWIMALIQVSAAELKAKAGELRNLNSQFKTQVGNLESQEQTLISMWEGEARDAFNTAFNNDKMQMDNFYNLIEQYCAALEAIAAKYELAEAQNVSTAASRTYK